MIKTTVVGSYPIMKWLAAYPGEQALNRCYGGCTKNPGACGA